MNGNRGSYSPVEGRLAGKVVLLTGAGRGQGGVAALLFAQAGAQVFGCDVDANGLQVTLSAARLAGLEIDVALVDVTDRAMVWAWMNEIVAATGGIDVLCNNAADVRPPATSDPTPEPWRDMLRRQFQAVAIPTRVVWRHLIAGGGGSIINIAPVFATRRVEADPEAYRACSGGIVALTHRLAAKGSRHRIRANSILPVRGEFSAPAPAAAAAAAAGLRRTAMPVDLVYTGLFLASDESAYVTGADIPVTPGLTGNAPEALA